ncbi:MAG: response regulator [Sulfurovum sp.]|nr:MAG: response regulator [Sulfurovum sp.]
MNFKVLIVDDDYINRMLLTSLLKRTLYKIEIIESVDGEDALRKCKENLDIQLILLDVEMPNMDGSKFLINYKKNRSLPDIPIIAVSSNDLRIKEILELGAHSFLVKPVTEEKLLSAIMKSQKKQR